MFNLFLNKNYSKVMYRFFSISQVFLLCFFASCHNGRKTAAQQQHKSPVADTVKTTEVKAKATADTYPLLISFYSIGEGIDSETLKSFQEFIDTYEKPLSYDKIPWGREGEVDYCLILSELNPHEKRAFITKAKELVKSSKLVHVKEDTNCSNKSN